MKQYRTNMLKKILDKGTYRVDLNAGVVISRRTGEPVGQPDRYGYVTASLIHEGHRYGYRIHEVIAFVGGLKVRHPLTIDHKDGNKLNNALSNLESVTRGKNIAAAFKLGLREKVRLRGESSARATLTDIQVEEIRQRFANQKISMRALGREYGVRHTTIRNIVLGLTRTTGSGIFYGDRRIK